MSRKGLGLGVRHFSEDVVAAGQKLHINVLGLASIATDVTPDLAGAAIASVTVLGGAADDP